MCHLCKTGVNYHRRCKLCKNLVAPGPPTDEYFVCPDCDPTTAWNRIHFIKPLHELIPKTMKAELDEYTPNSKPS